MSIGLLYRPLPVTRPSLVRYNEGMLKRALIKAQIGLTEQFGIFVAAVGSVVGLIGGRLYFLATSWNEVPDHWWGPFAVWQGGLGIWGGIAAGTAAGVWVLRRRNADIQDRASAGHGVDEHRHDRISRRKPHQ